MKVAREEKQKIAAVCISHRLKHSLAVLNLCFSSIWVLRKQLERRN